MADVGATAVQVEVGELEDARVSFRRDLPPAAGSVNVQAACQAANIDGAIGRSGNLLDDAAGVLEKKRHSALRIPGRDMGAAPADSVGVVVVFGAVNRGRGT